MSDVRQRARIVFCVVFLAVAFAPACPRAAEPDFNIASEDAYVHFREAYFHARTGNTPVAAIALDGFVEKWTKVVDTFAENPPPEYAGDSAWQATLREILTRAETGLEALDADDAETARDAINPIRTIIAELRHRNNVAGWVDTIDELSAAMAQLARFRSRDTDMEDGATMAQLRDQGAIVEALFEKCRTEASPETTMDPEFKRLVEGAAGSMANLWRALDTKDARLMRISIGELRGYERIIYLRFG